MSDVEIAAGMVILLGIVLVLLGVGQTGRRVDVFLDETRARDWRKKRCRK